MRALGRAFVTVLIAGSALATRADEAAEGRPPSDEGPSATAYRPSVSTPAALSAPGWLEIEGGGLRLRGDAGGRRDSLPYTVKLAFTPDWGVRISGEAWVRRVDDGQGLSGGGDTAIVLKRRFAVDDRSAFGLEGGVLLPTARSGLGGGGRADWSVNGIYSADLPGDFHTDLNLLATRLGQPDPGATRVQLLWAAALAKALNERWAVLGELSGTYQRGAEGTTQLLVGASFNVSRALVLDAGVAHSLRSGSSGRAFFAGFTWLAARLF